MDPAKHRAVLKSHRQSSLLALTTKDGVWMNFKTFIFSILKIKPFLISSQSLCVGLPGNTLNKERVGKVWQSAMNCNVHIYALRSDPETAIQTLTWILWTDGGMNCFWMYVTNNYSDKILSGQYLKPKVDKHLVALFTSSRDHCSIIMSNNIK